MFPVPGQNLGAPSCPIDGECVDEPSPALSGYKFPVEIPGYKEETGNAEMVLYLKAAEDKISVGDCPFAHYVRLVLEEKGLKYKISPCVHDTKPDWLLDFYEGKMPALRIGNKCIVESSVIVDYLISLNGDPPLQLDAKAMGDAEAVVSGLFPSIAKYLKHTPDGDSEDEKLKSNLEAELAAIDAHLETGAGPFLAGESVSIVDCSVTPKLFHLVSGLKAFKSNAITIAKSFPSLHAYIQGMFSRESFRNSSYPPEVIAWGWSNARS